MRVAILIVVAAQHLLWASFAWGQPPPNKRDLEGNIQFLSSSEFAVVGNVVEHGTIGSIKAASEGKASESGLNFVWARVKVDSVKRGEVKARFIDFVWLVQLAPEDGTEHMGYDRYGMLNDKALGGETRLWLCSRSPQIFEGRPPLALRDFTVMMMNPGFEEAFAVLRKQDAAKPKNPAPAAKPSDKDPFAKP